MPDQKSYEMLFAFNARMNGGFSSTFSKAQAEFTRLGKEIQGLHRVQGDIASYQKQQAAIDATDAKLKNLEKQQALVNQQIKEARTAGESTAALEREELKLQQQIKNANDALERQNQKLTATGARLNEAGVNTANLAQKDAELTAKIRELEAEQEKAAEGAASFGEKSAQAFGAAQQAIAAAGVTIALKEITDAFVECVGVAGDFEEAMSTVEALSRANAQEMAALAAEAKELGATTKFTAKESADAMGYMAMAGWDATDMLQGMDGVLQLAAASGEDLAMVSDIVTDSLSAFGLTAQDTAHFSDVLAAAATSSNTNVAIMGETFKQSASVAGALGYSIEDVAVAMGLMANSGVKGSIAGTALKNTFNGLLEGVTLTGAAFGEYEYSAVKADGTMKDFGATINELRGYFEQMTEAERVNNAMAIAGQRGYNGLLAILNATDADYASLTDSIKNCTGAAQRMAAVKLDNMNGQLTLMKSAWDALKTTIGEQFMPEMRGLYEIGTDVFSLLDEFVQENPALVKGVVTFTGVMGTAVGVMTAYAAISKVIKALNMASMFTNPVFLAIAGAGALVGGIVALTEAANEGIPSVRELTEASRELADVMAESSDTYHETMATAMATADMADSYISRLEAMGDEASLSASEQREYQNTLALLLQLMPELSSEISQTTDEYGRVTYALESGTDALRENADAWRENAKAQAYQEYLTQMYGAYADVLIEAQKNSIGLTEAESRLEHSRAKYVSTQMRMNQLWAGAEKAASKYNRETGSLADATGFLSDEYYSLQKSLYEINDEIYVAEQSILSHKAAIEDDAEAVAAAEAEIDLAERAYEDLTGATQDQTGADEAMTEQALELQGAIEDTAAQVASLAEAYRETYSAALESMQGQYALWDKADDVVATSSSSVNEALQSQAEYWRGYNANLQTLMENAGDVEGLSEMLASLDAGDSETVNFVAGLAEAAVNDKQSLKDMVKNWQDARKEQENAASSFAGYVEDLQGQMDELGDSLFEDIEDMNLSDEAAESGALTILGYLDGANSMLPQVRAAFEEIGSAAIEAMVGPYAGVKAVPLSLQVGARGYASGTRSAEPGWAEVGENGPELIFFGGGETVLNAAQTSALRTRAEPVVSAKPAADRFSTGPMQVVFQIDGNATPDTVQDLREFGNEIIARVIDTLDERAADEARRAFW